MCLIKLANFIQRELLEDDQFMLVISFYILLQLIIYFYLNHAIFREFLEDLLFLILSTSWDCNIFQERNLKNPSKLFQNIHVINAVCALFFCQNETNASCLSYYEWICKKCQYMCLNNLYYIYVFISKLKHNWFLIILLILMEIKGVISI